MATLVIRKLDDALKERLQSRATSKGHSMEQEARLILSEALEPPRRTGQQFVDAIRSRFTPLGGVELDIPPRKPGREPPSFDE